MLRGKRQLGKETKNWLQFIFDNNKNTRKFKHCTVKTDQLW